MATVVCDFIQIIGDGGQNIPPLVGNAEVPLPDFNTGGREANFTALLFYSAKNLTGTAQVFINGNNVGTITATPAGGVYSTQSIAVRGIELKDGQNEIVLKNVTDQFTIKNVNLFFHQSA
jgi:hypothetical protein